MCVLEKERGGEREREGERERDRETDIYIYIEREGEREREREREREYRSVSSFVLVPHSMDDSINNKIINWLNVIPG
jgi:hypothetical protein